jgi:hypothetical protein
VPHQATNQHYPNNPNKRPRLVNRELGPILLFLIFDVNYVAGDDSATESESEEEAWVSKRNPSNVLKPLFATIFLTTTFSYVVTKEEPISRH